MEDLGVLGSGNAVPSATGADAATEARSLPLALEWQPIATAPTDRPIVGWCVHGEDPYWEDESGKRLTTYAAHVEGLGHVPDGAHVLVWGGEYWCGDDEGGGYIPDWWFRAGSEWEEVANPTHWAPVPFGDPTLGGNERSASSSGVPVAEETPLSGSEYPNTDGDNHG